MTIVNQGDSAISKIKNMLQEPINGITELEEWLTKTLLSPFDQIRANNDGDTELYRQFRLGDAKYIFRVHLAANPQQIKIWFYDVEGRVTPKIVKKTIASFFQTNFGFEESPLFDLYEKAKATIIANTFIINNELPPIDKELHVIKKLMQEKFDEWSFDKDTQQTTAMLGLFQPNKQAVVEQDEAAPDQTPKTPIKNN